MAFWGIKWRYIIVSYNFLELFIYSTLKEYFQINSWLMINKYYHNTIEFIIWPYLIFRVIFFLQMLFFLENLKFTAQFRDRYRDFPYTYICTQCIASLIINNPQQSGILITTDEPTWTHINCPKSIIYIRVQSQCCICCGFGETYNDMYPSLYIM